MEKKYESIVFDLGNTVIRFDYNIAARKMANLCHLDKKAIYDAFFDTKTTRAFESGELSPKEFYSRTSKMLALKIPFRDFVAISNDIFWEDADVAKIVRRLKAASYRLFLLSNLNRMHYEYIVKKFDIIKEFEEFIPSFAVGAIKPDKKIFDYVVARAGGDRSKLLYIDDREDLIKEARIMGIDSIRFENASQLKSELEQRKIFLT